MPKMKCAYCVFFCYEAVANFRKGECRRNAPNPVWPVVKLGDGCGQYEEITDSAEIVTRNSRYFWLN